MKEMNGLIYSLMEGLFFVVASVLLFFTLLIQIYSFLVLKINNIGLC